MERWKNKINKLQEFYDEVNSRYIIFYPNYKKHNIELANSISKIITKDKFTFIDIGCGVSNLLYELAKKYSNGNFVGIDISKKSIDYCNENYKSNNIKYLNNDWNNGINIIKQEAEIDYISCFGNTFCHYAEQMQIESVKIIQDTLNENGFFVFDTYADWNLNFPKLVSGYILEPKNISREKDNTIIVSIFFSKYSKSIATRHILLIYYDDFNKEAYKQEHFTTQQYPINKKLLKNLIAINDDLKIFNYYGINKNDKFE